ncbi:hypothetical protein F4806DRAFT_447148 [Annulohypoxylon nitens]|nr:hypothetical protein F4806DRAFT_447148 [Annulohypoxylon nitens]
MAIGTITVLVSGGRHIILFILLFTMQHLPRLLICTDPHSNYVMRHEAWQCKARRLSSVKRLILQEAMRGGLDDDTTRFQSFMSYVGAQASYRSYRATRPYRDPERGE